MILLEEARKIFMTIQPTRTHIRQLSRSLHLLDEIYDRTFFDKLNIILNRDGSEGHSTALDLKLPIRPAYHIPSDPPLFNQTASEGVLFSLLDSTAAPVQTLKTIACHVTGEDPAPYLHVSWTKKLALILGLK